MRCAPALLLALAAGPALAQAPDPARSPHARDLEAHRFDPPARFPPPARTWSAGQAPRALRTVYGYYPYWVTQWDQLHWDLLTHIAYFAIEMNTDGTPGTTHGWPDRAFVDTAHMHGVRADLCFTLFSGPGIATLVSSATNRARAIDTIISAMEAGGADGVNIDFEGMQAGSRDDFTTLVRELRQALTDRGHPDAGIAMAGPAVDWSQAFDLGALSELIDVYFIMGYGYHWGGSGKPGPVGQLKIDSAWRPHASISMERTLDYYTALVAPAKRSVIVLGVPYYGEEWPAASGAMHAATTGDGSSRTYAVARRAIAAGRARQYDDGSENAWYAFESAGAWRQTWYDDEESLAAKYQLALDQNIGGVGMWALGYDEDYPELWQTLDAYFTAEPEPPLGSRQAPLPIDIFPFEDHNDTRLGPGSYFNRYGCDLTLPEYGREWVYGVHLCRPGRLSATLTDGPGVDIDLHLLSAPDEQSCLQRSDSAIDAPLPAGRYLLVADTYVNDYVAQPGAYTLRVDFQPDTPGGDCVLTPGGLDEGRPEVSGQVTRQPAPTPMDPMVQATVEPMEEGCGCTSGRRGKGEALLVALLVAPLLLRRRCAPASSGRHRGPG